MVERNQTELTFSFFLDHQPKLPRFLEDSGARISIRVTGGAMINCHPAEMAETEGGFTYRVKASVFGRPEDVKYEIGFMVGSVFLPLAGSGAFDAG